MSKGQYVFCLIIDILLVIGILITGFAGAKVSLTIFGIIFIIEAIKGCSYDVYIYKDMYGEYQAYTWLTPLILFGGMAAVCFIVRDKANDMWINILNGICLIIFAVVGMFLNFTYRELLRNRVGRILGWIVPILVIGTGLLSCFQLMNIYPGGLYISCVSFVALIVFGFVFMRDAIEG